MMTRPPRFAYAWVATEQERRAAFARWFSNSLVVDSAGHPLPVYHGAPSSHGTLKAAGQIAVDSGRMTGLYSFSTQDAVGAVAALAAPVYLRMVKPLRLTLSLDALRAEELFDLAVRAREQRHDGLIIARGGVPVLGRLRAQRHPVYVVMEPEQIRSAAGKIGWRGPLRGRLDAAVQKPEYFESELTT